MYTSRRTTKLFVIRHADEIVDPENNRTVFKQLRPILWSLKLLGFYSDLHEDAERPVRPWYHDVSTWTCVTLGLLHAYALASLTACIEGDIWTTAYNFFRTGSAVVSSHAVISKGPQVCALIRRLGTFSPQPGHDLKKTCTVMVLAVLGYVFLRVAVHSMILLDYSANDLSKYATIAWFGIESQPPASVLLPLCLVDVVLNSILVTGSLLLSVALYLALTVALRHRYEAFNDAINRHVCNDVVHQEAPENQTWATRRENRGLDVHELRELRQLQTDLGVAVLEMDTHFSPTAFAWVSFFVLGACAEVSRFLGHHESGLSDQHRILVIGLNLGSVTLMFVLLAVTSSRLSETSNASMMPLHRALGLSSDRPQEYHEGLLLISQLRAPAVVLTGWGFFYLSRGFVLTLAGALLSYVIIILQLNSDLDKDKGIGKDG
ncbi:unnamed protein product [Ixodes persulcatus]